MWSKTRRAQLTIMHDLGEVGVEGLGGKHGRDIDEKDIYAWQCEMKNIKILTVITYRLHILNAINFVSLYFLFLNHDNAFIIEIRYFKYCGVSEEGTEYDIIERISHHESADLGEGTCITQ